LLHWFPPRSGALATGDSEVSGIGEATSLTLAFGHGHHKCRIVQGRVLKLLSFLSSSSSYPLLSFSFSPSSLHETSNWTVATSNTVLVRSLRGSPSVSALLAHRQPCSLFFLQ
jgi:hypothetical protein